MWLSLIGFMASGKSTVARSLAEHALLDVRDLDSEVEAVAGCTASAIFAHEGEPAFRERELAVLADLPADDDLILACGGGVVETPEARRLLRDRGTVIWLDAPWEVLRRRLETSGVDERPQMARGWTGLEALLRSRLPLYASTAHFRLRSDLMGPRELVSRALACNLRRKRRGGGDPK